MYFKATSWFERNYKNILTVIVVFVSIGAVFYYFSLQDKSDTGKAPFLDKFIPNKKTVAVPVIRVLYRNGWLQLAIRFYHPFLEELKR